MGAPVGQHSPLAGAEGCCEIAGAYRFPSQWASQGQRGLSVDESACFELPCTHHLGPRWQM